MNRFVIVTFDMDGSMVTFEGSRFTETQQAAIFYMVERAGREPTIPGIPPAPPEPQAVDLDVQVHEVDTPSGVRYVAEAGLPVAPVTPVTGSISATQRQQAMDANRDAAKARAAERVQQARGMGYTGDLCTQCGSDRMKRNGSCLCCESCGATTGCS